MAIKHAKTVHPDLNEIGSDQAEQPCPWMTNHHTSLVSTSSVPGAISLYASSWWSTGYRANLVFRVPISVLYGKSGCIDWW
jgi:hypothetical protein